MLDNSTDVDVQWPGRVLFYWIHPVHALSRALDFALSVIIIPKRYRQLLRIRLIDIPNSLYCPFMILDNP